MPSAPTTTITGIGRCSSLPWPVCPRSWRSWSARRLASSTPATAGCTTRSRLACRPARRRRSRTFSRAAGTSYSPNSCSLQRDSQLPEPKEWLRTSKTEVGETSGTMNSARATFDCSDFVLFLLFLHPLMKAFKSSLRTISSYCLFYWDIPNKKSMWRLDLVVMSIIEVL